ncbi:hypothetical protein ACVBEQ_04680 [Nakamurella sp. GG22]
MGMIIVEKTRLRGKRLRFRLRDRILVLINLISASIPLGIESFWTVMLIFGLGLAAAGVV